MNGKRMRTVRASGAAARTGEEGMTLVEIMMAAGILAVAIVLAMGSVMSIAATGELNEGQAVGMAVVSSVMEELRTMPYPEVLGFDPPSVTGPTGTTAVRVVCFDRQGAQVELPQSGTSMANSFTNPFEVLVEATWRDTAGRTRTVRSTTFLGR